MSPPPRAARALLRLCLPRADRDGAIEELDEKFAEYAAAHPDNPWVRRWYWRQVAGLLHPRFWRVGRARRRLERRGPVSTSWMHDVRFGARMLLKTPGMTAVILVTLAVGIGFNGAMFSLLNTIVLNDLPIERPREVLFVKSDNLSQGRDELRVSYPDFQDFVALNRSFENLAGWAIASMNLSDGVDAPQRLVGAQVSASIFDVLGVEPVLGRRFEQGDTEPGAELVGLLGYGLWRTRYGADEGVLGRVVQVNGNPVAIVGVLPAYLEQTPFRPDLWTPLQRTEERETSRDARFMMVAGRLRAGGIRAEADAEFKRLAEDLARRHAATNEGVGAVVETFQERFTETPNRVISFVFMGAVAFLLLIACANVANLLISRAVQRSREVVIRAALGASRWRVVRQLLIESLVLSVAGGAAAIAVAVWGARTLEAAIMNAGPPVFWDFSVRPTVFVFIAALSLATGVIFGLAPALHATRSDAGEVLKDGGRGSSGRRSRRLTNTLVIAQLVLSVVLLTGAGLIIRSALNVQRIDWAVDPDDVLTMRLTLDSAAYPGTDNLIAFYEGLEERLRALPSVESAALASSFPSAGGFMVSAEVEQLPVSDGHAVQVFSQMIVSPSYFEMADATALRGRLFNATDGSEGDPVVVVEQRLADRYWPDADPIGQRFRWIGETERRWMRVVGVVPSIKQTPPMELSGDHPVVYTPYRQEPLRAMGLMIRSPMDPQGLAAILRQEVQEADPDLPLFSVAPLADVVAARTFGFRVAAAMFLVLGATALFLSCIGIYAVMAFAVGRRRQEIGIRVALGAHRGQVLGLVLRGALPQVGLGLLFGLIGAIAATRLIAMFMYDVSPTDPLTFAAALTLLVFTALTACLIPARRASRVDPLVALRDR